MRIRSGRGVSEIGLILGELVVYKNEVYSMRKDVGGVI